MESIGLSFADVKEAVVDRKMDKMTGPLLATLALGVLSWL